MTFAGGVVAGVINTLAGGGGLLAVPILILGGLPATVANGTYRLAVVLQNVAAVTTFHRRGIRVAGRVWPLLVPSLAGAALGVFLAVDIDETLFRRIMGVALVAMLIPVLRKSPGRRPAAAPLTIRPWMWPAFFGLGFYGGFLQIGIGFLYLALLAGAAGLDLVRANAVKVFLILGYSVLALVLFALHGRFALVPALALAAGNAVGGWLGARIAVDKGERWIRWILVIAVTGAALEFTGAAGWLLRTLGVSPGGGT